MVNTASPRGYWARATAPSVVLDPGEAGPIVWQIKDEIAKAVKKK